MEQFKSELSPTKIIGDVRNLVVGCLAALVASSMGTWIAANTAFLREQGWGTYLVAGILISFLFSVVALLATIVVKAWRKEPIFHSSEPIARSLAAAIVNAGREVSRNKGITKADERKETWHPVIGEALVAKADESETVLEFHAQHALTAAKLRICLDVSYKMGGIHWTKKLRIRLAEFSNFIKDEHFSVPLVTKLSVGNEIYGWGDSAKAKENLIALDAREPARCRLTFISDGGEESYFAFLLLRAGNQKPSRFAVVDVRTFGNPDEWFV